MQVSDQGNADAPAPADQQVPHPDPVQVQVVPPPIPLPEVQPQAGPSSEVVQDYPSLPIVFAQPVAAGPSNSQVDQPAPVPTSQDQVIAML